MKYTYYQVVDGLTWIHVEGTPEELERAEKWVEQHKTMWVHAYPMFFEGMFFDSSPATPSMVKYIMGKGSQWKTTTMGGITITAKRKFCFKSAGDALRFKLAH